MKHIFGENMTFLEAYLNGCAAFTTLDNWIEYWHTHDTHNTLKEFLGLDEDEYWYLIRMDDDQAKGFIDLKYKVEN